MRIQVILTRRREETDHNPQVQSVASANKTAGHWEGLCSRWFVSGCRLYVPETVRHRQ